VLRAEACFKSVAKTKFMWPKFVKELVANARLSVGGQCLLKSWWLKLVFSQWLK